MTNKQSLITKLESSLKLLDSVITLIGLKKKLLNVIIAANKRDENNDNNVHLPIDEDELKAMEISLDKLLKKSIAIKNKYKISLQNKSENQITNSIYNLLKIFQEAKESFEGIDEFRSKQITIH